MMFSFFRSLGWCSRLFWLVLMALVALVEGRSYAAQFDWPTYLGPNRNSISSDPTPLADSWPEEGPPVCWSVEVNAGHGGAAIVDGRVYVMDRVDSRKDVLLVIDLESGELIATGEVESPGRVNYPGARSVPTVTSRYVFTAGPMGMVAGWRREDLSLVWKFDILDALGAEPFHVGYAVHPQAYRDLVIISARSEEASVVALHAETGEMVWKAAGLHGSLATPLIRRFLGRDQVLYISNETPENPKGGGAPSLAGLDPESGEVLWRYRGFLADLPISPPVVVDEDTLFVTAAYEAGAQLLQFGEGPNPTIEVEATFRWGAHICPPNVFEGHLYFLSHENETLKNRRLWHEVGLRCISEKGESLWNTGAEPMFGRGSMILADGKLVIRDSYYGKLYLVKPAPSGYQQLAMANPFDHDRKDLKRWAPLAISRGFLVVRDERVIKCLDLRKR